jgi:hypothetical protein
MPTSAELLLWLSRFIQTLEDGSIDSEEAQDVLLTLAEMAERIKECVRRRSWKWICQVVAYCLREGAAEIKRKEDRANGRD